MNAVPLIFATLAIAAVLDQSWFIAGMCAVIFVILLYGKL
jgi:hypothetical protein